MSTQHCRIEAPLVPHVRVGRPRCVEGRTNRKGYSQSHTSSEAVGICNSAVGGALLPAEVRWVLVWDEARCLR